MAEKYGSVCTLVVQFVPCTWKSYQICLPQKLQTIYIEKRLSEIDNAKSFKKAAKTIRAVLKHPDVQSHFARVKMEWSLEKAPWTGGIFERMVRSTKRCLKKTIGRTVLMYDEAVTIMTEVEMILNSRPLSYISTEDIEPHHTF